MYRNISHSDLYHEYEARVDRAVRNYQWAAQMQPVARSRRPVQPRLRVWLTTIRRRLERHLRPAEEGYIA